MSELEKRVDEFLLSVNMHPQQTDMRETMVNIMSEMKRGLAGDSASSLAMIPTYISINTEPRFGENIIVMDVGGTNLRVGLASFSGGKPSLSALEKYPVPGSCGELTASEFFDRLAEKIFPFTTSAKRIGMCFSYPADIFPNRDGRIIRLNKEIKVTGAEGAVIGEEIISRLKKMGAEGDYSFTLLNDTTAGLMGAVARLAPNTSGGMAGLVVGTGLNCCYFEHGVNITKLINASDMIINCESGCFDRCYRGEADFLLDEASELPGDHLLEKMCGGAYLGLLITKTAELAAKAGLLSESFLHIQKPFTSLDVDELVRGEKCRILELCAGDDAKTLCCITERIFERAARLVCAMAAAVCEHCDGGKSAEEPFLLCAEGSTFWSSMLFREKFSVCAEEYIFSTLHRHLEVIRSENATLEGAALAVFTAS